MKKGVLKFIAFFITILLLQKANAQDAFSMATDFMQDGAPKYASSMNYGDLEGSPYLYDGWATGYVLLSDGKAYKNILLKYNEIEGTVVFKYALTDSAMAFAIPAVEFKFTYITNDKLHEAHLLNGFAPVANAGKDTFYQLLTDGSTKLLKRTEKRILKHTEYGSAEVKRTIEETTTYYLARDKKPVRIKNDNKSVIESLKDKGDKVKQYITENKLNAKDDNDFAKIIDYYNTI